jgi:L-lactate dehydrogenase complex protein LldG
LTEKARFGASLVGRFTERARAARGEVHRFATAQEAAAALAEIVVERAGRGEVVAGSERGLERLLREWRRMGLGVIRPSAIEEVPDGAVGLAAGESGIAETGSVAVDATGFERLASVAFVEVSVIVVDPRTIVADLDAAAPALGAAASSGRPSTVRLVTGPSRTGDIEQSLTLGAHGPREVHVFLMGAAGAAGGKAEEDAS